MVPLTNIQLCLVIKDVRKDFATQKRNKCLHNILCNAVNKQLQLITLMYSLMLCSIFKQNPVN